MFTFHIDPEISEVDDLLDGSSISEYLETDDPVVALTSWKSLSRGGQDFKSHTMVRVDEDHLEFRISLQSILAYLSMSLVGVIIIFVSIFGKMIGMSGSGNPIVIFLVGLLFSGLGFYLFKRAQETICINRAFRAIYKGSIDPASVMNPHAVDYFHSLDKLHAVQLLQKYVKNHSDGKNNSYFSYELNLVLNDGTRIKVLDHGNVKAIVKQSNALAEFLQVPLWNVTWPEDQGMMGKIIKVVKLFGFIGFFIVAVLLVLFIYNSMQDDKQTEAAREALPIEQKIANNTMYTKELFDLVKSSEYDFGRFERLVRQGADIRATDTEGRTLLFYAVLTKNGDYIRYLMNKGADLEVKDESGIGLKDLLDPVEDKVLYYAIVDAELHEDAMKRGKTSISVSRKFDENGKMLYQKVEEY